MVKKKYYAVANGRNVGIYTSWNECEKQVKRFFGHTDGRESLCEDRCLCALCHGDEGFSFLLYCTW